MRQFQSPTSRGGLCNYGKKNVSAYRGNPVSIPYFAGRPLQPVSVAAGSYSGPMGFNPLLRGAAFATSDCVKRSYFEKYGFNPLLRGAAFATRTASVPLPFTRSSVSIPYFAGRPLQRAMIYAAKAAAN